MANLSYGVTVLTSIDGSAVGKELSLNPNGTIQKSSQAHNLAQAKAQVISGTPKEIQQALDALNSSQAVCWGILKNGLNNADIATIKHKIAGLSPGALTRTNGDFIYPQGPGVLMFDCDRIPYGPDEVLEILNKCGQCEFDKHPILLRTSSSSNLKNQQTGVQITGLANFRIYLFVDDASLIPEATKILFDLLWLNGYGHIDISRAGSLLLRTIFDDSVFHPNTLDYAAKATYHTPLVQSESLSLLAKENAPPFSLSQFIERNTLSPKQIKQVQALKEKAKAEKAEEAQEIHTQWLEQRAQTLHQQTGLPIETARNRVQHAAQKGTLEPDHVLTFKSGATPTVAEVQANLELYKGDRAYHPFDQKEAYSRPNGVVFQGDDGQVRLHCYDHGGETYILKGKPVLEANGVVIPDHYELRNDGVYSLDAKKPTWLCGPLIVTQVSVDPDGKNAARCLQFKSSITGQLQKLTLRQVDLLTTNTGSNALSQLADYGFSMTPNHTSKICTYIMKFENLPIRVNSKQLGWITLKQGDQKETVYVLPDQTISRSGIEVQYIPAQRNCSVKSKTISGTWEDWRQQIAAKAVGNPIMIVAISYSLAGAILHWLNSGTLIIHFYGTTSRGKTTLLQIAASVWGNGSDPDKSKNVSTIQKWNATDNGLEGSAAQATDKALFLDELGQNSTKDAGKIVYKLAGGQGKQTMNSDRSLRESYQWQTVILSTGELPIRQEIQKTSGTPKGGQLVRIVDHPVQDSCFQNSHGLSSKQLVDSLKSACSEHYGHAGLRFIENLVNSGNTDEEIRELIDKKLTQAKEYLHTNLNALQPEQSRAIDRMAPALAAGLLAVDWNIVPWTQNDVIQAFLHGRDAWLSDAPDINDVTRGIESVENFLLTNGIRFQRLELAEELNSDLDPLRMAGYVTKTEFLIFKQVFEDEVCRDFDAKMLCKKLEEQGYLKTQAGDRYYCKRKTPKSAKTTVYVIEKTLLEQDTTASFTPLSAAPITPKEDDYNYVVDGIDFGAD